MVIAYFLICLAMVLAGYALGAYNNRHQHKWEETSRNYTEPYDFPGGEATGYYTHELLRLYKEALNGFTVITYRCECGKVETERRIGKVGK